MHTSHLNAFRNVANRIMAMSEAEFLCRLSEASAGEFSQAFLETSHFLNEQDCFSVDLPEVIRGETFSLVRVSEEHADALLLNWGQDKATFASLSSIQIDTPALMRQVIEKSTAAWQDGVFFRYTILSAHTTPAGLLTFTHNPNMPGYIELGIRLGSSFWKQGIGQRSVDMIRATLRTLQQPKPLFATCMSGSPGHALLARCGFSARGILPRRTLYNAGGNRDALCTLYTDDLHQAGEVNMIE